MGYLSERVNYLRGLVDGMEIDKTTKDGKLLNIIIDILDDMAISIEDVEASNNELMDSADDADERLCDIEDYLYGDEDDEDECDCDCCDCDCCDCEDCEDEDCYAELECPACGNVIELEDVLAEGADSIICPACNEKIEIEWEDDDDECDCGCCCDCHKE